MCWDSSKGKDEKTTWKSVRVFLILSGDTPVTTLIVILFLNDKKVLLQGFQEA